MLESEHYETLIRKMGGDPDKLPDRLTSTYLEELCACAGSGNGIGYTPETKETLFDEDVITVLSNGNYIAQVPSTAFTLEVGSKYEITLDDVVYVGKCTLTTDTFGDNYIVGDINKGENTVAKIISDSITLVTFAGKNNFSHATLKKVTDAVKIPAEYIDIPSDFVVTFTPVTYDNQDYMTCDKRKYEIIQAYEDGKNIKARIALQTEEYSIYTNNIIFGVNTFSQDDYSEVNICFYNVSIYSQGTNGILKIKIIVIGDEIIAPIDSPYDYLWIVGNFLLNSTSEVTS